MKDCPLSEGLLSSTSCEDCPETPRLHLLKFIKKPYNIYCLTLYAPCTRDWSPGLSEEIASRCPNKHISYIIGPVVCSTCIEESMIGNGNA